MLKFCQCICPEPFWARQPDPSFRHAALELPQAGITPPSPILTLWKVPATARMGRRGNKTAGSTTLLCLLRRQLFQSRNAMGEASRRGNGNHDRKEWTQEFWCLTTGAPWAQIKWEAVNTFNTEKVKRKNNYLVLQNIKLTFYMKDL